MAAAEVEMAGMAKPAAAQQVDEGYVTSSAVPSRPCKLYYQLHTNAISKTDRESATKVLLVHGLGCKLSAWEFQLDELLAEKDVPMLVCVLDNRGIGQSDSPLSKQDYSTDVMAQDVLHIMDHLNWQAAHYVGFSMGAMAGARLALRAPERVQSLSLLGISGGGVRSLPHSWRGWRLAIRGATAKTPRDKAWVDVKFHFSRSTLRQRVLAKDRSRQEELLSEYQQYHEQQPGAATHGIAGQMHACWRHRLRKPEVAALHAAGVPVLLLHGRHDLIANARYAERLAKQLGATCVLLDAAHFIPRESRREVNKLLLEMFRPGGHAPVFATSASRHFR